jgi:RIO kinase 1
MSSDEFEFTPVAYTATDHELLYLREALGEFHNDQWFTDILFKVKGGKEATVYCCRAHPSTGLKLVAAKVYRPRMFRAMRNDAFYRIGRTTLGPDGKMAFRGRAQRALKKHTAFGQKIEMASWNQHEFNILSQLHDAGLDVPKPLAHGSNCILMQYLGDESAAAPTLQSVRLDEAEARSLFHRLLRNVEQMLSAFLIHGDLSAHNILYHNARAWIIDFPQAVAADGHPAAYSLLARDIERLCQYFQKQGVDSDPGKITHEMWSRYLRQEIR